MTQSVLRTVIVESDPNVSASIHQALAAVPSVAIVGEYADVAEAAAKAPSFRPDVIIAEVPVDPLKGDAWSAAAVERLARRLPETAVVATANNGTAEFVLQIIRAGAMEVVRRPVDYRELLAALEKLGRFRGRATDRQPGRVTAIFSAKGGLGATTLAVNLAVCIAEDSAKSAALVELDTRHSDIVTFLDLQPRYSILDVFESIDRMDESLLQGLMVKHASGLSVLPAPSRVERGHITAEHVHASIDFMRAHFDHIVVDLRHELDQGTIAALEASDTVLFLTALNVSALRSAAAALTGFRHIGLDAKKIRVVIMREGTGVDVNVKHVRDMLGLPIYWKTPSEYGSVVTSINKGRPVVSEAPRSKFAKSVRQLADMVVGDGRQAAAAAARRPASLLASAWPIRHLSGA